MSGDSTIVQARVQVVENKTAVRVVETPTTVEVTEQKASAVVLVTGGKQGIPGPPGPMGPGATVYSYVPPSPLALWVVNHNLGYYPSSVRVLSPGGVEVNAEVVDISINQLQIIFSSAQSGRALIS